MVKFSGFADEVFVDFAKQLEFFKSISLSNVELRFLDGINILDLPKAKLREVKQMLADSGMGVSAIASPIGKYGVDKPFEPHFDRFKHAADVASMLGTELIRVFSFYAPEGGDVNLCRDLVMERMAAMADYLKGSNIKMAHENEAHIYGHSAENCVDIARTVNSGHLVLAYDPANFVWGEGIVNNVETCWPLMRPFTSHIHIKDWKLGSKDIGSLPGEGDGQIEMLIKELAAMNYDGFVTLEPHMSSGGQFGGETKPEQMFAARDTVKSFCEKYGLTCE